MEREKEKDHVVNRGAAKTEPFVISARAAFEQPSLSKVAVSCSASVVCNSCHVPSLAC